MFDTLLLLIWAGHLCVPVIGAWAMYYKYRKEDLRRRTVILAENIKIARGRR